MSSKHERGADDSDGGNAARSLKVVKSDKTTAASSSASATTTTSLANFMQLPHELRLSTLELACYKPPQQHQSDNISKTWRLQLDIRMICNLILVSREFQSTFQPLLYAHVKLGRPSILAAFHASLVSRPSNAALVKSIWLGPLGGLGDGWWPVEVRHGDRPNYSSWWMDDDEDDIAVLKTSLRRRDAPIHQLPRWAKPGSEWTHEQDGQTCQEQAVAVALAAAIESVNIYFSPYLYDEDIEDLGINEWTIRLFEVQAVLDLYLCALRRVDDASGRDVPLRLPKSRAPECPEQCRAGKCGHYPKLKLIGFDEPRDRVDCGNQQGKQSSERDKNLTQATASAPHEAEDGAAEAGAGKQNHLADCIITREQVKNHISRRGAITDHYEHPIVYARSKSRKLAVDDDGRVFVDYKEERTQAERYLQELEMDSDSESCDFHCDSDDSNSDDAEARKRPSKAKATVPQPLDHTTHNGILALARSVLGRTTRLTNLALTGSFRLLLDEELPVLRTLRFLSLGPLSPLTDTSHCLSNAMLPALEQLRICGGVIGMAAARKMAGQDKDKSLPRLKKIVWDFGSSTIDWYSPSKYPNGLLELFDALSGRPNEAPAAQVEHHEPKSSSNPLANEARPQDDAPQHAKLPRRNIEVWIPPAHFAQMPTLTLSPAIRAAWLNGTPMEETPHVLHVLESRAVMSNPGPAVARQDISALRKDSKAWWEERAVECDGSEGPQ